MNCCNVLCGVGGLMLCAAVLVPAQESPEQTDALALLAKLDGKVRFDPAHPKRVIGIDI